VEVSGWQTTSTEQRQRSTTGHKEMTEQIPSILSKDSFWNEKSTRCLSGELFLMTLSLNPAKASTGNCEKNIQHLKIGDEFRLFGKQQQTFKTDKRKMQGHPLSLSPIRRTIS